jgi:hypothetical protein
MQGVKAMEFLKENWQLLIPLILLEFILKAICLVDLSKRQRVLGGIKPLWALAILFINTVGPIAYLAIGRKE